MKYLIILSLLLTPVAYAHDRDDPKPILPPVGTSSNDNHNNDSDNLKHAAEAILLTGAVVCIIKKCWRDDDKITVKFTKGIPNETQP